MAADDLWFKQVSDGNGGFKYEVVLSESKLSGASPFTTNQNFFIEELSKTPPNLNFDLRSTMFVNRGLDLNAKLEIKAYVKTVSDGTSGIGNYTVTKIP